MAHVQRAKTNHGNGKTLRTLTVGELRDLLEGEDDSKPVLFTCDYGDYHHTAQALPISGETDEVTVSESAYSQSGWAIDEEEGDEETVYLVLR